jgi:Zn finger protein HypA/HybF involved in hydrogenase expression
MNPTAFLQALGSIGLFPARIFLPAFITALLLRFGPHVPLIAHAGLLGHVHNEPAWFTSNISLIVFGALSVLEILGQKNPEARHILHEFDAYLKAGLAALTSLGVISATDASFVKQTVHQASFLDYVLPLVAALGTFRVSQLRRDVLQPLHEHVEGTHLDRLISWAEESWVAFGALVMVVFPVLMLLIVAVATGVLMLVRRRMRVAEEHARIPCGQCGTPVYACAMACPKCRKPVDQPCEVGFLGHSKPYPADDLADHPYRLVEKKRCPVCATHLKSRQPHQTCGACGQAVPADAAFAEAYLDHVAQRLPTVLGICFLFSLVPIVGLIAGAVYYRMALVLPFSQYLPFGRRFLLNWGIRLLFLFLAIFQIVPLLGGLVVPLMALVSFTMYRNSYRSIALPGPGKAAVAV